MIEMVDEDYARLRAVGISTVRESARWHLIDRANGDCDFATCRANAASGCASSNASDLDTLSLRMARRRRPAVVAVHGTVRTVLWKRRAFLRERGDESPIFIAINEISFLAWAAGETGWFYPYLTNRGAEVKRQLVRASIAGINAIRRVVPQARIVTSEPLIHVVADNADTEQAMRPRGAIGTVSTKRATC